MASMDLLGVKPEIGLVGGFQRQLIVLYIVSADTDPKSAGGEKFHRLGGGGLHVLLFVGIPEIAAGDQLPADIREILFCFGTAELIKNAFQIGKLSLSLLDLLCQIELGILCFIIVLEVFGRILLGRQGFRGISISFSSGS